MSDRRERLARARLYLVCDRRPEAFLRAALAGGVDVLQLRDKDASDDAILAARRDLPSRDGARPARCSSSTTAPTWPAPPTPTACTWARTTGRSRRRARSSGADRIVGRSTHSPEQIAAAGAADYIAVGPVHATPTKPGRPAVGLELVRHAAAHAPDPWFAIGGIDSGTVGAVVGAGARRVVVVRALTEADDPEAVARALRAALVREEAGVGTA